MEENQKQADHGQILAKWNFPEFTKYERKKSWYFWVAILIILLLIYSIVTINFLFAVIVILAAITFTLIYRRKPYEVTFAITEDGLSADERFFPYEILKNFYIIYKPPEVKKIFFEFKSLTKPRLAIPLEDQNPVEIRKFILEYLTEDLEKEDEPLSESLGRLFKL